MSTPRALNPLLDKLVKGVLNTEERAQLIQLLEEIEKDPSCTAAERMAAMLMRASLEARSAHHVG